MNLREKVAALRAIDADELAASRFMDAVVERMPEEMQFSVEECTGVDMEKFANQNLRLLGIAALGSVFSRLDHGSLRIHKVQSPFLEFPPQFEKGFMQHGAIHDGNIGRIALSRRIQVQSCYGSVVNAREMAIWKIPEGATEWDRDVRAFAILRNRMDEMFTHPTFKVLWTPLLER